MTDQNNAHINQTTFFNIDVYNDNSTGGDISSIYQTSLQSPLLMHPNEHEICCCRARIPLDQIPLSQNNIPFNQWQIEVGVPIVSAPNTYNYYQSYVPQFNAITSTTSDFNIGINGLRLQSTFLPENEPTTTQTLILTPNVLDFVVGLQNPGYLYTGVANIASGLIYTAFCSSAFNINRYLTATGAFVDSVNLRTQTARPNLIILGLCMPSNNSHVYACCYDPDTGGYHFLIDVFNYPVFLEVSSGTPAINLYSISCSTTQLSMGYRFNGTDFKLNFTLSGGSIVALSNDAGLQSATYIDSDGNYFVGNISRTTINIFTQRNIISNVALETYTIPSPDFLDRFIGSDIYGNLLVSTINVATNVYTIRAYGKNSTILRYNILMGTNQPLVISNMIQNTSIINNPAPYPIFTINEYLDQINLAFVNIMNHLPLPLSSPTQSPFLTYDSTLSIISINVDASATPSSSNIVCKINFNKLLMSFFKFTSSPAVSTNLGVGSRTITINSRIVPQPNSTLYRFADLTRILIGTSRISVKGDNQSSNQLLVNFSDFVVDTSNGIPNLIIYQPAILRWYQLYQTSPLNNLDVFVSYANRAGEVFPINISPYNSIGLKLQFRNSNSLANAYSDR